MSYNTQFEVFPANFVATLNFAPTESLVIEKSEEKEVPNVQF